MRTTTRTLATLAAGALLGATITIAPLRAQNNTDPDIIAIGEVLDDFHDAAAKGDFDRYFGHFAKNGRFLGTDKTERWSLEEFKAFARPLFTDGAGWTYVLEDTDGARSVIVQESGSTAWFDELLQGEKYGSSRGTGTMVYEDGAWKIAQYHLSFPIPNDLATVLTTAIKQYEAEQTRLDDKADRADRVRREGGTK